MLAFFARGLYAIRSGMLRSRCPVAAKIALATAGAIGDVPGSPTPPTTSARLSIEVHRHLGRIGQADRVVVREVRLLDRAVLQRDLADQAPRTSRR